MERSDIPPLSVLISSVVQPCLVESPKLSLKIMIFSLVQLYLWAGFNGFLENPINMYLSLFTLKMPGNFACQYLQTRGDFGTISKMFMCACWGGNASTQFAKYICLHFYCGSYTCLHINYCKYMIIFPNPSISDSCYKYSE